MKYPIDPKATRARAALAREHAEAPDLTDVERLNAVEVWSDLEGRIEAERMIVRARRIFWWATRIGGFSATAMSALSAVCLILLGQSWALWATLGFGACAVGMAWVWRIADQRLANMGEEVDREYPV